MPLTAQILLLTSTGDMKNGKLTIKSETTGCQLSDIQTYLKIKEVRFQWVTERIDRDMFLE